MDYSIKNQTGGKGRQVRTYFFENLLEFLGFHFIPGNSKKYKPSPLEALQNCVTTHRNFKTLNQDPLIFHMPFSWSPLAIPHCLLLVPIKSTCYFFNNPGSFISSTPPHPCLFVFPESSNAHVSNFLKLMIMIDRANKNDANTLSWHMVNASFWTSASHRSNSRHLFWNLEDPAEDPALSIVL